jgi:hypothetical protein
MWISHTGILKSSTGAAPGLGWEFVVSSFDECGIEHPLADRWEESFLQILRYPGEYADHLPAWVWEETGQPADLRALQSHFDESGHAKIALAIVIAPTGDERLAFNLYGDGEYRFIREERLSEGGLEAWLPKEWSRGRHLDLASAKAEARETYLWAVVG